MAESMGFKKIKLQGDLKRMKFHTIDLWNSEEVDLQGWHPNFGNLVIEYKRI